MSERGWQKESSSPYLELSITETDKESSPCSYRRNPELVTCEAVSNHIRYGLLSMQPRPNNLLQARLCDQPTTQLCGKAYRIRRAGDEPGVGICMSSIDAIFY